MGWIMATLFILGTVGLAALGFIVWVEEWAAERDRRFCYGR